MWHYLWGHIAYHLVRWFPRNNRIKIFITMMALTLVLLAPQIFVLIHKHTTRWCAYHLFELLIVSLVFTFVLIGFTFLFMLMIPVPREVKIAFHIFGFMCFVEGLVLIAFVSQAEDCKDSTEALYILSLIFAWLAAASIVYFVLMLPFWIINKVKTNSVLDTRNRNGVCYEPVKCCSCLWHI